MWADAMERLLMISRTTTSVMTFVHPFILAGYTDELPAGDYEVIVDEELIQSLSFAAYRRTATHIMILGQKGSGRTEMRPVAPKDLELAASIDKARSLKAKHSVAALSPLKDLL